MPRPNKKMKLIQLAIPAGMDVWDVVKLFKHNYMPVDDMCTATSRGMIVQVWIEPNEVYDCNLEEKVGYFLSEGEVK